MREQAFLPAGQEHGVEFQPLGGMQRHDVDRLLAFAALAVHHQRDVLEEALQVLEFLHGAHQLLEVFQPAGGVGAFVVLPHRGVARLVQHDLGQLVVRRVVLHAAPALEARHQVAQREPRLRLHLVGGGERGGGFGKRDALLARVVVQHLQRSVAEAALGHVDDALEGEIVGRLCDHAQVGERVADFHALVEARAADHAIGQAELNEAVLEFAHLERGAHQDGDLVERMVLPQLARRALQLLDLLANRAGFLFAVPGAGDLHLFARHVFGAQRLAEAAFVVGNKMARRSQNMSRAAVISFQPNYFRAGKIMIEPQNIIDLGASPSVNRLIVIAHTADVFLQARCCGIF